MAKEAEMVTLALQSRKMIAKISFKLKAHGSYLLSYARQLHDFIVSNIRCGVFFSPLREW